METNEQLFTLVEDYLADKLDAVRRNAFEKQYQEDADFAAEVDSYTREIKLFHTLGEKELKDSLSQRFAAPEASHAVKKIAFFRPYSLAVAAAAVLLIAVFALTRTTETATIDNLFAENFQAPNFAARGTSDGSEDLPWQQAASAYQEGNYELAAKTLEVLVTNTAFSHFSEAHLYLGVCYLKLDQPHKAIASLSAVRPESVFLQNAEWFSLLSYLQLEDTTAAKKAAKTIISTDRHYKKVEAEKILQLLERF